MIKLILIRHGESIWNKENIFTGWTDIKLSYKGIKEAKNAGVILKKNKIYFEHAYTSYLKRAIHTLWFILNELDLVWMKVNKNWELNERHYGALQGHNKDYTTNIYGQQKVLEWRRSYKICPPKININDKRYPGKEIKYKNLKQSDLPLGESLLDTFNRVIPFYKKNILTKMINNKNIIIVAHGNSLRALIKYLENISDENIVNIDIPTGIPLLYEFDNNLTIKTKYYLNK